MPRTVEIGRAVLSSQTSSLQLWLTTLITVSSEEKSINLQQLNQAQILEYLLSGNCWVCRGNGLHLALELTVPGEALGNEEREQLATNIVNAPVWKQLHLHASIPAKEMDVSFQGTNGKSIRINIDHRRTEERSRTQLHRIGQNVPFADVRPPPGIPLIHLQSVKLDMAFLRSKAKSNAKKQKVDNGNDNVNGELTDSTNLDQGFRERELCMTQSITSSILRNADTVEASSETRQADVKETPISTMEASRILAELLATRGEKRKIPTKGLTGADTGSTVGSREDICEISKCIDGALRISICKGAVKLPQGIKLVTSTFVGTLSEICPAVWRLQYLLAISQRAHLLPTITRSLGRVWPRAKSLSMRSKLDCLAVADIETILPLDPRETDTHTITSAHIGLWQLVQRRFAERPMKAYEAFCSHNPDCLTPFGTDEILDQRATALETDSLTAFNDDDRAVVDTQSGETSNVTEHLSPSHQDHFLNDQLLDDPLTATEIGETQSDDLFIANTCEEDYISVAGEDPEIEILQHTDEQPINFVPADFVNEHSGFQAMAHPLDAHHNLERSGDTLFDESLEEAEGGRKDRMFNGSIDEARHSTNIANPISIC